MPTLVGPPNCSKSNGAPSFAYCKQSHFSQSASSVVPGAHPNQFPLHFLGTRYHKVLKSRSCSAKRAPLHRYPCHLAIAVAATKSLFGHRKQLAIATRQKRVPLNSIPKTSDNHLPPT